MIIVGDVFLGSAAALGVYSVILELSKPYYDDKVSQGLAKLNASLDKPLRIKLVKTKKKKQEVYVKPAHETLKAISQHEEF